MSEEKKPIFRELNADDPDPEATEIESLCMNCHANVSKHNGTSFMVYFFSFLGCNAITVN